MMKKRGELRHKAQAALEFLTTYGWALLVILIMIGALAYFGILNPSTILAGRCIFGSEIGCVDYSISPNTLNLRLKNNVGEPIVVDDFAVESDTSTAYTCTPPASGFTWKPSEVRVLSFTDCNGEAVGMDVGEKAKVRVTIRYHKAKSSASYSHEVAGEVFATVVTDGAFPPPNNPPTITLASDSPDPVTEGSPITFNVDWNDLDAEGTKMFICKTNSIKHNWSIMPWWCLVFK